MFDEVRTAAPYAALTRRDFDDVLGFVENGGYALPPTTATASCSATPKAWSTSAATASPAWPA